MHLPPAPHLDPHDGEVWHWRVVHSHAGVGAILDAQEDFGGGGGGAVVQHLAQRVDVDVLGREAGPDGVVRARHAFNAVCNDSQNASFCLFKAETKQGGALTSVDVGVRLVGPQEHGLARFQHHVVEKVDGEAADVSGILGMQAEQQGAVAARSVLPCRSCRGQKSLVSLSLVDYANRLVILGQREQRSGCTGVRLYLVSGKSLTLVFKASDH